MVEYAVIASKNFFSGMGSFLPHLQSIYRSVGLNLSPSESLMATGIAVLVVILGLGWLVSK